jgi:hypothetical protein
LLFAVKQGVALVLPLRFQIGKEENSVATSGFLPGMQQAIQSALRHEYAPQQEHLQTGGAIEAAPGAGTRPATACATRWGCLC